MELSLWTYLVAITILTITPGVDTMIVIRNTLRGGLADGLVSSLGICSGLFVHAFLSAVGISAILLYSAFAFTILKTMGAIYLLWLGFSSFKAFFGNHQVRTPEAQKATFHFWISVREGFLSNVLNPKAVIFYMAFLPQFISPESSALTQSMFLAFLHFLVGNLWQGFLAYMIVSANGFIMKKSVRKSMDFIAGSVMILLSIKLFLTHR